MQGVPYLAKLSGEAAARHDLGEIRTAIDTIGYWERHDEWRISTVTSKRIVPATRQGRAGFLVSVKCDHEFNCHCPTLERAVEMVSVYDRLIEDLFLTIGWPSWAKRDRLEP